MNRIDVEKENKELTLNHAFYFMPFSIYEFARFRLSRACIRKSLGRIIFKVHTGNLLQKKDEKLIILGVKLLEPMKF